MLELTKMRKPLVIIEAPGKIETFRKILSGMGIYNAHIEATKGRIYDLPKNELGINLNNYSIESNHILNEKKFDYLTKHIENSSHILLFTDSDIEGEVIAYHSSLLVKNDTPIYRCETQSLNESGIIDALSNYKEIDPKKVISGLSRRSFDRLIGYGCSTENWSNPTEKVKGNVGRIITPLLNKYYNEDPVVAKIQKDIFIKDEKFFIDIDVTKSNYDKANDILVTLNSIELPAFKESENSISFDNSTCPDSGTFLSGISDALDISIIDSNKIIEELYEDGDISYPRTDSFYLSQETIEQISDLAYHFGVSNFNGDVLKEKALLMANNHPSQEAHEALHPLSLSANPFSCLDSHDLKEQVLILLMRNVFRAGQEKRKIIKRNAEPDINSRGIHSWNDFISDFNIKPRISRTVTTIEGSKKVQLINNDFMPLGIKRKEYSDKSDSRLKMLNKDLIVFDMLRKMNIGRPSTNPYHAKRISSTFISSDYSLNFRGIQCLNKASMLAPGLLSETNALEINNELMNIKSGKSLKKRIEICLEISGIDSKALKENLLNISGAQGNEIKDESDFNY